MKNHTSIFYVAFIGIGALAALGLLHFIPGDHNFLDAKMAVAIGSIAGLLIGRIIVYFSKKIASNEDNTRR